MTRQDEDTLEARPAAAGVSAGVQQRRESVNCPECGYAFEIHSMMDDDGIPGEVQHEPAKPTPGDFSLCLRCGSVLRYTEEGVRPATESDWKDLAEEPESFLAVTKAQQAIWRLRDRYRQEGKTWCD